LLNRLGGIIKTRLLVRFCPRCLRRCNSPTFN